MKINKSFIFNNLFLVLLLGVASFNVYQGSELIVGYMIIIALTPLRVFLNFLDKYDKSKIDLLLEKIDDFFFYTCITFVTILVIYYVVVDFILN